ncbi:MAG: alpha/beta hydrolase [Acidihalobacter sp.]
MNAESSFFKSRDGLRLHCLRWGRPEALPAVMLHGLRGYAQTWESLFLALGERFCCYSLDQRGRGLSDWADSATYRTDYYVADLETMTEFFNLERFYLIGHSLGGANSLEYALQHPGRLRGLVVEDIGPGSSIVGDGAERIRREMMETPLRFEDWDAARRFWQISRPGLSKQSLMSRLEHSMRETDQGIMWRHDQQGISEARLSIAPPDLWPAVRALDCPTLFIRGGRSDFLPLEVLDELRQANAHIRAVEIPDASHYVHDDQTGLFNRVVLGFLQELADSENNDGGCTA